MNRPVAFGLNVDPSAGGGKGSSGRRAPSMNLPLSSVSRPAPFG